MIGESSEDNVAISIYAAPRKFDISTIMVVTIAYALLFGVMNLFHAAPEFSIPIAVFVTCVGIGQALLFQGKKPRTASAMVGAMLAIGLAIFRFLFRLQGDPGFPMILPFAALFGALYGYFAGILVGSVFLFSNYVRRFVGFLRD